MDLEERAELCSGAVGGGGGVHFGLAEFARAEQSVGWGFVWVWRECVVDELRAAMSRAEQVAFAAGDFGMHILAGGRDFGAGGDHGVVDARSADEDEFGVDPGLLHFGERGGGVYSLE